MNHTRKVSSSAGHGGGVYVRGNNSSAKGKVYMTSGEISGNKAGDNGGSPYEGDGGGIYNSGIFEMSGGTIKSNNAKNGGGVCISDSGTFTMSGNAKIEADNDVYLNDSRMITVNGTLTPAGGIAARLTPETYGTTRQVLDGSKVGTEHGKFTVTPKGSEHWIVGNSGTLLNFGAISLNEIKVRESSMTATQIIDRKANWLGKLVLYKTSEGNYGIMHVTEVDNTSYGGKGHIKFNYKTFNADGSVKKNRDNCESKGTYKFDLDNEASSGGTDFWLENSNSSDAGKLFKPGNGAKFYVLP